MIKRTLVALLATVLLLVCTACTPLSPFEKGEVLSAEEVEARRAALLAEQEANAAQPYDGTCYWLKSGTVYHISLDCTYIKDKENVLSGTVDEALAAGKERCCSRCGG